MLKKTGQVIQHCTCPFKNSRDLKLITSKHLFVTGRPDECRQETAL